MSLYADYIKERENKEIIENVNGFLTYRIVEKECFLADMFIVKEHRGKLAVKQFIIELYEIAKAAGCSFISANIFMNDQGANRTLKAAFKLGFKLIRADNGILLIHKEVIHG